MALDYQTQGRREDHSQDTVWMGESQSRKLEEKNQRLFWHESNFRPFGALVMPETNPVNPDST